MNPFKGGLGDLLQQAQKMREDFKNLQEAMAKRTVEATAGGGMVKVVANGKQQIISLTIEPELLKLKDAIMLQDLVVAGVNQAIKASQEMVSEEMGKLTGGLGPLASMLKGM
jgi:nucleoid-associated protein EbfC